ncbi:MAG: helicase [Cenarchaeum symbiont of Oopsacas minuta]|nr:helicase [Cenarchaeum symbiont of Oopsacas minuta]
MARAREAQAKGIEHSKIPKLIELLSNLDGKALVFSSYRDSVEMIRANLKSAGMNSCSLIGKAGKDGLKQKKQIETIEKFRNGEYNILVSTRVGEEGLDISEVNLVIFYDNVPSSIRFIQRRGRTGRKDTGKLIVLIANKTIDEAYYWIGQRKIKQAKNMGEKMVKHVLENPRPDVLDAYV